MRKEIEIQQEYLQELFRLIKENPDLPIVPTVDSEIVADDGYQSWMGSWGKARKTKYYRGYEYVHFYEPDDWDEIESTLNDSPDVHDYVDLCETTDKDERIFKEMYEALDWVEAIEVNITTP